MQSDASFNWIAWSLYGVPILWIVGRQLRMWMRRRNSQHWPEAQATINPGSVMELQPDNPRNDQTYDTIFRIRSQFGYSFLVDGRRYGGVFAFITDNRHHANELQRQLDGRTVPVRYNPGNPDDSVLASPATITTDGLEATQDPAWLDESPALDLLRIPK